PARACRLNFLEGAGGGAPRPVGPAGRARRARRMPVERAPARNGDSPVLEDGEELRLSEQRTRFVHGPAGDEGEGVLHLTTRRIVWLGATSGYAMDYPFVTLHAISRDKAAWPDPCLYCQLRCEEVEGEEEEEPEIPEVRFVPSDPAHLQTVFQVFSEMSALNPDPNDAQADDSSSDGEDEDDANVPQFTIGAAGAMGKVWAPGPNDDAMEDAEELMEGRGRRSRWRRVHGG
ncbi:unnamed protein product, partial [Prorocentrum cordatum]